MVAIVIVAPVSYVGESCASPVEPRRPGIRLHSRHPRSRRRRWVPRRSRAGPPRPPRCWPTSRRTTAPTDGPSYGRGTPRWCGDRPSRWRRSWRPSSGRCGCSGRTRPGGSGPTRRRCAPTPAAWRRRRAAAGWRSCCRSTRSRSRSGTGGSTPGSGAVTGRPSTTWSRARSWPGCCGGSPRPGSRPIPRVSCRSCRGVGSPITRASGSRGAAGCRWCGGGSSARGSRRPSRWSGCGRRGGRPRRSWSGWTPTSARLRPRPAPPPRSNSEPVPVDAAAAAGQRSRQ